MMNYKLLLLLLLFITFIRRIYNYIPGSNHVLGYKNDTDVLWLMYLAHVMLFSVLNVLQFYSFRIRCAVPSMAVFRSSLTCIPGIFLDNFRMILRWLHLPLLFLVSLLFLKSTYTVLLLLLLLLLFVTFILCIHNYIPETHNVSSVYIIAAIL